MYKKAKTHTEIFPYIYIEYSGRNNNIHVFLNSIYPGWVLYSLTAAVIKDLHSILHRHGNSLLLKELVVVGDFSVLS